MRKDQPFARADRIGDMIGHEISDLLHKGIKDPRIGFVTVTGVKLSADLKHAKVFVSVIGSDESKRDTLAGLNSASGFIQHEVGRRLRLRNTPVIQILLDEIPERAARINALLRDLSGEGRS